MICRLIVQQVAKNAMSEKWIFGYVTLFSPIPSHNGSARLSIFVCSLLARLLCPCWERVGQSGGGGGGGGGGGVKVLAVSLDTRIVFGGMRDVLSL